MKNLEWKAELRDPNLARLICQKIGATKVAKIRQTDTYYNITRGPDQVGPKVSEYSILSQEELHERFGQSSLPVWLVVTKVRELYLMGSTRIHIDDVHDLGWHFEFEILINSEEDADSAPDVAEQLRSTFLTALGEPIRSSYSQLLEQHQSIENAQQS
jgi:adenylate cyclase class IV